MGRNYEGMQENMRYPGITQCHAGTDMPSSLCEQSGQILVASSCKTSKLAGVQTSGTPQPGHKHEQFSSHNVDVLTEFANGVPEAI